MRPFWYAALDAPVLACAATVPSAAREGLLLEKRTQSLLALHVGMLVLGGTALFAKLIDLPALDITAWRSVFAAAALLLLLLVTGLDFRLRRWRDYAVVAGLGVLFALHWVTYFHAMQVSTIAVGIVALFTFPVITVFLEPLVQGGRPRRADIAGALLALFGVYLMVPGFSLDSEVTLGVCWGVVSAVLYATRNVLQRQYFRHYPGKVAIFWQILVVWLLTMPFTSGEALSLGWPQWALIILLGVVFTALPHTLFANSLRHFQATTVSLINCLQVFYAVALAAVVLHEIPELTTVAGGLLIIGAAVWESLHALRRPA